MCNGRHPQAPYSELRADAVNAAAAPQARAKDSVHPERIDSGDSRSQIVNVTYVTPEYFDLLRIPVVGGRAVQAADTAASQPVIVVNQAFVRRYSPEQPVIGRQIASSGTRTIVGVVGDVQQKVSFGSFGPVAPTPAAYVPVTQLSGPFFEQVHVWFSPSWMVRVQERRPSVIPEMEKAVKAVDPLLPFAKVRTLDQVRGEAVATQRAQAMLLSTLSGLALVLAAIGLYGLVASSVSERTRELGTRMALGASTRNAMAAAAAPGAAIAVVALGLAGARLAATVMRSLVWGVSTTDPMTFALAAVVVLAVTIAATLVPALRIVRLNPISALRRT